MGDFIQNGRSAGPRKISPWLDEVKGRPEWSGVSVSCVPRTANFATEYLAKDGVSLSLLMFDL